MWTPIKPSRAKLLPTARRHPGHSPLDASRLRGLHLDTSHAVGKGGSYEEPTQACTMTDDYVRIGSAAQQVT